MPQTQNQKRLLILDLDGTLFDTNARFHECQKLAQGNKRVFWNCYQSSQYMSLDKPIESVVNFVKSIIDDKTTIIIISGRSEKQRKETIRQLEMIGIKPAEIILRGDNDFRKDYEFKSSVISELLKKYSEVSEITLIDDSNDVLNHISSKFPQIKVIDAKTLY